MGFFDSLAELMNFDKPSALKKHASSSASKKIKVTKKTSANAKVTKKASKLPTVRALGKSINVRKIAEDTTKTTKLSTSKRNKDFRAHKAQKKVSLSPLSTVALKTGKKEANSPQSPYQDDAFANMNNYTPIEDGSESKEMICAPGEDCFWVCDGRVLSDLSELGEALGEIEDDIFEYHANEKRHDFAQWVEDVLCDGDCAKKLRETRTRHDARRVVLEALDMYR
ncbi:MAG: hypothetical protein COV07_00800 [Candidatus Vogelbacteria bacterium CG10_big_fil_rev_8_21_14_0_10_45_14]|uniref:Uncharacterized protein n=1 Tax=Candidatus Vogelbacteria bacterium CG10_big_fil_rev_8_21_14_0_10_45_14 TaxID=1975042 RepID=A0A2H0RKR6_9BACT|nr:MAG: hypothetical protein COV07_00800 [Candidatus Vogelbacteria bacterium CG10_big_fil_rev_8_21_14_0_10_45_14]